jgi:4-methyl-5(b-hydroxyethyl)-thiazole monophosphate biosynthesis
MLIDGGISDMTHVAVLFAPGFEEIESMTIVDVLRRAGIKTHLVGLEKKTVKGAHQVSIRMDTVLDESDKDVFDAVVLPGGAPGYINLKEDSRVLDLLNEKYKAGNLVAAVCASPAVLAAAGILKGKKCTIYPGMEDELRKAGGDPVEELVVVDENIVTSRGPATTILFALKLVELLKDSSTAETIASKTLLNLVYSEK